MSVHPANHHVHRPHSKIPRRGRVPLHVFIAISIAATVTLPAVRHSTPVNRQRKRQPTRNASHDAMPPAMRMSKVSRRVNAGLPPYGRDKTAMNSAAPPPFFILFRWRYQTTLPLTMFDLFDDGVRLASTSFLQFFQPQQCRATYAIWYAFRA